MRGSAWPANRCTSDNSTPCSKRSVIVVARNECVVGSVDKPAFAKRLFTIRQILVRSIAHIGELIRVARIQHNLNLEDIADGLGITYQQIQKYEKAHNDISAVRLWEFVELLHLPPDYFFRSDER